MPTYKQAIAPVTTAQLADKSVTAAKLNVSAGDINTITGGLIRALATNPLDSTPGNRPTGVAGAIGTYNNAVYLCTSASTPTWVKVGPA